MKASELRIGNWLNWFSKYHCNGYFDKQLEIEDFTQTDLSSANPIPLTEEWLLNFGFTKDGESFIYGNGWLIVDAPTVHYSFDVWRHNENYPTTSDWSEIPNSIEYVHQLQNLYFALTNEELTFKSE